MVAIKLAGEAVTLLEEEKRDGETYSGYLVRMINEVYEEDADLLTPESIAETEAELEKVRNGEYVTLEELDREYMDSLGPEELEAFMAKRAESKQKSHADECRDRSYKDAVTVEMTEEAVKLIEEQWFDDIPETHSDCIIRLIRIRRLEAEDDRILAGQS